MTDQIRFSVVIPYHNKSEYIFRTIASVLDQTYPDLEVVIVDDGSTDDGIGKVRKIADPRIRIITQENRGESGARNRGIEEANNDYIAFLDADDEWSPQYLETIERLIRAYPNASIYCTDYRIIKPDHSVRTTPRIVVPPPPYEGIIEDYFLSATLGGPSVSASSATIKKEVLVRMGGFKTGYWFGPDTDLWGRIVLSGDVAFSWYVGATYHEEANNRMCNTKRPYTHPFIEVGENALREMKDEKKKAQLAEYVSSLKLNTACKLILCGRQLEALRTLLNCRTKLLRRQKMMWIAWSLIPPRMDVPLRILSSEFRQFIYEPSHNMKGAGATIIDRF